MNLLFRWKVKKKYQNNVSEALEFVLCSDSELSELADDDDEGDDDWLESDHNIDFNHVGNDIGDHSQG